MFNFADLNPGGGSERDETVIVVKVSYSIPVQWKGAGRLEEDIMQEIEEEWPVSLLQAAGLVACPPSRNLLPCGKPCLMAADREAPFPGLLKAPTSNQGSNRLEVAQKNRKKTLQGQKVFFHIQLAQAYHACRPP